MVSVNQIISIVEEFAPAHLAESWDNTGLLIGDAAKETGTVLLALDCTEKTIEQAAQKKAGLIITHHPLIFKPINRITTHDGTGRRILALIKNGIALYAAHTNLDAANGGVNDTIARILGFGVTEEIMLGDIPFGRAIYINGHITLADLTRHIAKKLNTGGVSYAGDGRRAIKKLGITGGSASGAKYVNAVLDAGCDAYLTGDAGYHDAQYAADSGLALITAPHFAAEIVVLDSLKEHIAERAAETGLYVNISVQDNQTDIFTYICGADSI